MAMHGTYDLILQKANWSLLVVLIHLSVEYISMVNQYIGSIKSNILVYICIVIQVLLISQTRSENSMESLTISWPFLVNIKWDDYIAPCYQHCCMAVKSGTWTIVVSRKSQSHGTTVSDVFFNAAGEKALNHYSIFAAHCQYHSCYTQRKLLFWKKLHCSESVVLQSLSRRMHHAFVAVGSLYNVLSPKLSNNSENWFGIHLPCLWTCDLSSLFLCYFMFLQ